MEIIVSLILLLLALLIANEIVAQLELPPRVKRVVAIVIGVIFLIWLLHLLGVYNLGFPRRFGGN